MKSTELQNLLLTSRVMPATFESFNENIDEKDKIQVLDLKVNSTITAESQPDVE